MSGRRGMSRRAVGAIAAAAALLALLELAAFLSKPELHGGFWNYLPLWDLIFGFLGAGALYALAKRGLGPLLSRPERPRGGSS